MSSLPSGVDAFRSATEYFHDLVAHLQGESSAQSSHGEIERYLEVEGRELLRRLFQGHLDRRADEEPTRESVSGSDGVERTHRRRGCASGLETLFGRVQVRRQGYRARGQGGLYPLRC